MPAKRFVWLGIYRPAPDNPPRHPRVEKVFASEDDARSWARERNGLARRRVFDSYYDVDRHELVPKRRVRRAKTEEDAG